MFAVAYERFQLQGFDSGKILVFWICGRLWELVAHGGSIFLDYSKNNTILKEHLDSSFFSFITNPGNLEFDLKFFWEMDEILLGD